ncbi:MarR family winged helix-turn-helix transcriptional regulator [Patescibacteria group bacterium]|nr:MarR family winged helix-turn-helix transcriptional regulator [Patescibacteria group bacterium]
MENVANLSEKEKTVLTGLYKLGKTSVGKLSKHTLINRTTLYPILDKLLSKGVVTKFTVEETTIYQAISLDDFKQWVKRIEEETVKDANDLMSWAENQKISQPDTLYSEIKYFEGFEGVKNLYADSWKNNKGQMIYAITDYKAGYDILGDFFNKSYFDSRVKHGVKVKNLSAETEVGREDLKRSKDILREMKFIKLFKDLKMELYIYDSKISLFVFDEKHPSGVLIKNDVIARAFKNIFEYLWKETELPKQ